MRHGLSFKNNYPEGQYRSFSHVSSDIRWNGADIGFISFSGQHNAYTVYIRVKDERQHCGWRNALLVKRFTEYHDRENLKAAKAWLKENWGAITAKVELHPLE